MSTSARQEQPIPVKLKGMDGDADLVFVGVSNYGLQRYVRERRDLSPHAKHVAYVLTTYRRQRDAKCCPSRNTLVTDTGYSVATVKRAIAELTEKGILYRVAGSGSRGRISRYVFKYDEEAARELYEANRMAVDDLFDDE